MRYQSGVRLIYLVLLLLVLGGFSAVLSADETVNKGEVTRELSEAVDAIKLYSVSRKDEAIEQARETMEALDKRIKHVEDRIDNNWDKMDAATRKTARETLHKLHEERNKLSEWYGGLKQSSTHAWGHVTRGFVESFEVLRGSLSEARSSYNGEKKE